MTVTTDGLGEHWLDNVEDTLMVLLRGFRCNYLASPRVRKSKNFPDSKIHAKTFRIKRVNRDTFAFATKVRITGECHVFLPNVHKVGLDGV